MRNRMIVAALIAVVVTGLNMQADAAPWRGRGHGPHVAVQVYVPMPRVYVPAAPVVVGGCYGKQYGAPNHYYRRHKGYNNGYGYNNSCNNNGYNNSCNNGGGYNNNCNNGYNNNGTGYYDNNYSNTYNGYNNNGGYNNGGYNNGGCH